VVYGVTQALVISQEFHLPRIMYLCNGLGINVTGVAADLRDYGYAGYKAEARELLARVKGWWQLEVSKPQPRSLQK
jgi:SanA protein